MKNIIKIFVIIAVGAMAFVSCEPSEDRQELSGAVTEADVRAKVTVELIVKEGKKSNYVHFNSEKLANCMTSFTHGLGTYVGTDCEVQGFVVAGTQTCYVNVLNADGTKLDPIPFEVEVEECFDVDPEWAIFCGSGEKVWTWDPNESSVWGNGGYLGNDKVGWWGIGPDAINGQSNALNEGAGASMVFSASGAKLIKKRADGSEQTGTFSFDMSKKKMNANGDALWAIGKLNTSLVTVLCGKKQNKGEGPVYDYWILKLNENELVLAWPEEGDGAGGWSTCWYWLFRAVE